MYNLLLNILVLLLFDLFCLYIVFLSYYTVYLCDVCYLRGEMKSYILVTGIVLMSLVDGAAVVCRFALVAMELTDFSMWTMSSSRSFCRQPVSLALSRSTRHTMSVECRQMSLPTLPTICRSLSSTVSSLLVTRTNYISVCIAVIISMSVIGLFRFFVV